MPSEMKLVIFDTNKVVQSVSREIDIQYFVQSVQDFQIIANETLTKIIEGQIIEGVCHGHNTNDYDMDQEEESSEDEDLHNKVTPKKRRH